MGRKFLDITKRLAKTFWRIIETNKNILKIVASLTLLFLSYVIYYYNNISLINIIKHLVISSNIIIKIFLEMLSLIGSSEILLKIILIGLILFLIFKYTNLKNILNVLENLNIELPNVKVSMSKLKKKVEATEALIESVDLDNDSNAQSEQELIKGKELMEALIDNSYLAKILNSFLLGKRNIKVPMRLISSSIVKIDDIKKIFEYEISSNSIKITKLKDEYISIAPKIYADLLSNNIIVQA